MNTRQPAAVTPARDHPQSGNRKDIGLCNSGEGYNFGRQARNYPQIDYGKDSGNSNSGEVYGITGSSTYGIDRRGARPPAERHRNAQRHLQEHQGQRRL